MKEEHTREIDASKALQNLARIDAVKWEPTLEVSCKTDSAEKARENKQSELKHKMENDAHLKSKTESHNNELKVHVYLWDRCSVEYS